MATAPAGASDREAFAAKARDHRPNCRLPSPQTGAEYLASLARRARGLHLRRARQGRHHASGLSQHRPDGGAALRCAARSQAQGQDSAADRDRQRRHDPRLLQGAENARGDDRRTQRHRRMGAGSPTAGWAARPTTRRRSWRRSAPTPTSTIPIRTMRGAGTSSARSACPSSITPSSIRRSIATGRPTRSATSAATSRRRPMPASSSRARRWWRPARC